MRIDETAYTLPKGLQLMSLNSNMPVKSCSSLSGILMCHLRCNVNKHMLANKVGNERAGNKSRR